MGQWVYEHNLTAEQEVAQWQEVFTPVDPYLIDDKTLLAKTQREINTDLASNAREIRQRAIRKELREREAEQSVSEIIVGQVRPITPLPYKLVYKSPPQRRVGVPTFCWITSPPLV
jgi:hypothetical protein